MDTENKSASLTLCLGDTRLQHLPLTKERITIGRRPHNDMVVDHPTVSADHAVVVTLFNDSFLEDLNSTNGTLINGQPVKKHFLQNGDVIELAKYTIRYHVPPGVSTAAPAIASARRSAKIRVLSGPGAGRELVLSKPLTSLGRPGVQVAVILERPQGYCLSHVEGQNHPLLNGKAIGASAILLASGDLIELSGTQMLFKLE